MPFRAIATLAVWTAVALAQPSRETRTFAFANAQTPQHMMEIFNAVRTIGELRDVTMDPAQRVLKVEGTADQVVLATWLFAELDRPAGTAEQTIHESTFNDTRAPAVRVYFPARLTAPVQIQEFLNAARSTGEVQRFAAVSAVPAIAVRASPEQAAYADWLFREIDQAADGGARGTRAFEYKDVDSPAGYRAKTVRIYYPAIATSPLDLQEIVNALRSISDVQRVVALSNAPRAVVLRASEDRVALTDWLFQQLDQAAPGAAPREYRLPDELVHVVGVPKGTAAIGLTTSLREATGMQRVVYISRTRSLVLRGTSEEVAAAESMLPE